MQHGSASLPAGQHSSTIHLNSDTTPAGVLTSFVPRFVQRKVLEIRSLRGIASTYIRPSIHRRSSTSSSQASIAPPPPYSEDPPSSDEDDMDVEYASASSTRPTSSGSMTPNNNLSPMTLASTTESLTHDLVRFKFANQGLLLVAQSAQELRTNPHANNEYQRRLYLDGVSYLLRALPEGLNEAEKANLQAALPLTLKEEQVEKVETDHVETIRITNNKSMLRHVVSTVVFWVYLAIFAALPYMRILAKWSIAFERKHKLREQCLNQGLAMLHMTYSQLLTVICAIWALNEGLVGRKLTEVGVWCVQNIGDGMSDGLREAVSLLKGQQEQR